MVIGTATKAQSCFNSMVPNWSLLISPCLKNKPAISPFEILSFLPPEINSVSHYWGFRSVFSAITNLFGFFIYSGEFSFSHFIT